MPDSPVIEMRNVAFAYNGEPVLEDATASIGEQDYVGIVGPNGGGKTTLLKIMAGLLKPTSGTVRIFGEPPERVRRRIGYVPQDFRYDPSFPVTVRDVVLMGRLGRTGPLGPYRKSDRFAQEEALAEVGLAGFARRPFGALSGGERQRVLVARALSSAPDVLLLDEPTANVDAPAQKSLHDLLKRLNERPVGSSSPPGRRGAVGSSSPPGRRGPVGSSSSSGRRGMTVALVTHDLAFVSRHVTKVLCVNRQVRDHSTCDVDSLTAEMLKDVYGSDVRMVRHDAACEGGPDCLIS